MKILLSILLILSSLATIAQNKSIQPGSKEYDEMKAKGKLEQPPQAPAQKNYPVARDARHRTNAMAQLGEPALASCTIENPSVTGSGFLSLPANDDGSSAAINLPFNFHFYGDSFNKVYVNNNGNISFDRAYNTFSSTGFPATGYNMIAPFWADIDTRGPGNGLTYYKVEATRMTVIWYKVGYFAAHTDKLNTIKLVITNGTDSTLGIGNNVGFYYGDMQWTTGDASQGTNGFYGIPATVGLNKGDGTNACFYYQIGRFGKPGAEFIGPYQGQVNGVDYLDNKCFFFDASNIENLTANFTSRNYACATAFQYSLLNPNNCLINSITWDFGDGTTSTEAAPLHAFQPGTYNVKLTLQYTCGACVADEVSVTKQIVYDASSVFKDTVVQVSTSVKAEVISSSVATFSDVWPLDHYNPALDQMDPFQNASRGVWRNEGQYAYDIERLQTAQTDIVKEGTYTLEQFNWANADLNAIPKWIKGTSMTQYSSYGYEVENRDILGVYTAALYDYGGHLPSANGVNMKYCEMAFTGFEYLDEKSTGNWKFGNQPVPLYTTFEVESGYGHLAVVKASLSQLENVQFLDVSAYGFPFGIGSLAGLRFNYIRANEIVCRQVHPETPNWSIVVLRRAPFRLVWKGKVRFMNEQPSLVTGETSQLVSHTGTTSLKVSSEKIFDQPLLKLDSGKTYVVSAWVSVNNPNVAVPKLADNLGLEITLKNKKSQTVSTVLVEPLGVIIEGWQQVKGTFTCPVNFAKLELKFKPGSLGTAWYDDLRLHPEKGNMKGYVYNLDDYRLQAVLDEENFASYYYYDKEGNLKLVKKETEDGIKTISENISYQVERGN